MNDPSAQITLRPGSLWKNNERRWCRDQRKSDWGVADKTMTSLLETLAIEVCDGMASALELATKERQKIQQLSWALMISALLENGGFRAVYDTDDPAVPFQKMPDLFRSLGLDNSAVLFEKSNKIMLPNGSSSVPDEVWDSNWIQDYMDSIAGEVVVLEVFKATIDFGLSNLELFPTFAAVLKDHLSEY